MIALSQLANLADAELCDLLKSIAETIDADPEAFGLTGANAAIMGAAATQYTTSLLAWNAARKAAEAAFVEKDTSRREALGTFRAYLNLMFATPTVNDDTVTSLGLAPRKGTRSEIKLAQPINLLPTPFADGTVKLKWNGNQNKYGVIYVVERGTFEADSWRVLGTTTRHSIIDRNAPPGVPRLYRVTATKDQRRSIPSAVKGVYLNNPDLQATLAAA